MTAPGAAIGILRTHWATRFIDTVTITRVTGRGALNPSYQYDSPTTVTIYTGGALVRPITSRPPRGLEFGQGRTTVDEFEIFVPHDAGDVKPDDRVDVTAATYLPTLAGKRFIVRGVEPDSYNTKQRIIGVLDHGPGEAPG